MSGCLFSGCPANFEHVASVNGCYKLVNVSLDWRLAGQICRALHEDAHLLVINDAAEQMAVARMLDSTGDRLCPSLSLFYRTAVSKY